LRLSLLAFNLASTLRIEYEAEAGSCCDLGRFQRDVLKAGGRVVKHARRLARIIHASGILEPPAASKKLINNDFCQRREAGDEYTGCMAKGVQFCGL